MPASKPSRPVNRPGFVPVAGDVELADVPRSLGKLASALIELQGRTQDRRILTLDLAVGANRINHKLGRVPSGVNITPTAADATWAWALTSKNARQLVITTVGVAQTGATVEIF